MNVQQEKPPISELNQAGGPSLLPSSTGDRK
jgi:hypothetical protein